MCDSPDIHSLSRTLKQREHTEEMCIVFGAFMIFLVNCSKSFKTNFDIYNMLCVCVRVRVFILLFGCVCSCSHGVENS